MPVSRRTTFRIAAVAFGILLVVAAELACRVIGLGVAADTDDPFVGFESVVPLFVADEPGDMMRIAEGRLRFFAAESFPVQKAPGTFRIFCLGGSTVQGRPFSIETSFTTWLQQDLAAADPNRNWEVINCGGVSYASYRLVPILQECLNYEPDLIIMCTGHNEFLEDRTYSGIKQPGSLQRVAGHSRLFTMMRSALLPDRNARDRYLLSEDVEARLDFNDGLQYYSRDDAWHEQVVEHFGSNLRRMATACETANVPLMFMLPPSNLADSPPFKTQPNEGTADQVRTEIAAARKLYATNLSGAIQHLKAAVSLDPRNAANQFELGRAYESAGQTEKARAAFIKARDEDICPLRMTTSLAKKMRQVVSETELPFVDLQVFFDNQSAKSISGNGILVDHIHPSFRGHQLIADELVRSFKEQGYVDPADGWQKHSGEAHRAYFKTLDNLYFLRGQRTLENLKRWARGRGHNLPDRAVPANGKAPD